MTSQLLNELDFPLAAPSANPFGSISPTTAHHVSHYFSEELDVILDGGTCERGIESTIIGFENDLPIVYRLGQSNTHDDTAPKAPGMLSRHYAPSTPMRLTEKVEMMANTFSNKKIGVLLFKNNKNLYAAMHRLDKLNLDLIIAERLPDRGIGKTLNDKLSRATK